MTLAAFCLFAVSTAFSLPELKLDGGERSFDDHPRYDLRPGLAVACKVKLDAFRPKGYTTIAAKGHVLDKGMFWLRVDSPQEGGRFSFFVNFGDGPGARVTHLEPPKPGETYDIAAGWDGADIWMSVNGVTRKTPRPGKPCAAARAPLRIGPLSGTVTDFRVSSPDPGLPEDTTLGSDFRFAADVTFDAEPSGDTNIAFKNGEYIVRYDVKKDGTRFFKLFINLRSNWEPSLALPFDVVVGKTYRLFASWDGAVSRLSVDGKSASAKRFGTPVPTSNPLHLGATGVRVATVGLSSEKLPRAKLVDLHIEEAMPVFGKPFTLVGEISNRGGGALADGEVSLSAEGGATITPAVTKVGAVAAYGRKPLKWKVDPGTNQAVSVVATFTPKGEKSAEVKKTLVLMPPEVPRLSAGEWTPPIAPTKTYYVDSRAGDDAADGLSSATAWKSLAPMKGKTLGPGERLLLKRGSVFNEELVVTAKASPANWAEIGAYGEGPRPQIRRNRHIDDRCAYVLDPQCLVVRDLVCANAGQGLEIDSDAPGTGNVLVERCLAHHIEGSYAFNSHGIPEWFDHLGAPRKGHPATYRSFGISIVGKNQRNVVFRDCEAYQCSAGFGLGGENAYAARIFCHDNYAHNTSPHPGICPTRRAWLLDSVFDASGWHASNGTMGLFLACNDGMIVRNCHFLNQPDSGSPDEGGIDFEAAGDNYLVDRCTFRNNAGPAIEVLGFMITQAHNIHIRNSRFDRNNVCKKLGPTEIFIGGGDGNHTVWCSTGSVVGNGYSLVDGVSFYTNREEQTWKDWTVADNRSFPDSKSLNKAFPYNEPPQIGPMPEIWTDRATVNVVAPVTDDGQPRGRTLKTAWEQIEGPDVAAFASPSSASASVTLPRVGDYRLLFAADDGELWRSARTVVHRLNPGERCLKAWTFARNLDKEGWRSKGLGTKKVEYPAGKWYRSTTTPVEPVDLVCGDYWVMAVEKATKANLMSEDDLGVRLSSGSYVMIRMMNHTTSAKMRLCWTTKEEPKWKSVPFDVKAQDPDDSVYRVALPAKGTLKRLGLAFSSDAKPITGTVRIDYIMVGARSASGR